MIQRSISGKARSHKSKDLKDHIVDEAKVLEVDAKDSPIKDIPWDAKQAEVHSDIDFSEDKGYGDARIMRAFDFSVNPQMFHERTPGKQEIFNAHAKQIEIVLMKDGLKPVPELSPRVMLSKNRKYYRIVVLAEPMKGFLLHERPETLMNIMHGNAPRNTV